MKRFILRVGFIDFFISNLFVFFCFGIGIFDRAKAINFVNGLYFLCFVFIQDLGCGLEGRDLGLGGFWFVKCELPRLTKL